MARARYRQTRGYENCQKMIYDGVGEYNIPALSPVNDIHKCQGWIEWNKAATARRYDNKGCHFFIDDFQFARLWEQPDHYLGLLRKFACVTSPDFSPYSDFPKAVQVFNHYRKHWLGRYWQDNGITVIPTITWSSPDTLEWAFDGEPVGGIVALSSVGMFKSYELTAWLIDGYYAMMDVLQPTAILWKGIVPDEIHNSSIIKIDEHVAKWRRKVDNV